MAKAEQANRFPDKNLFGDSVKWKNWMSELLLTTCKICRANHGKIYPIDAEEHLPIHVNGKCEMVPMRTKAAGTATNMGQNGVDVYLLEYGKLPDYYVTKYEAELKDWESKSGNLSDVLPDKMIGGDTYNNRENKLPQNDGRIWYEADFNYVSGYRNDCRIVYSNDGLIFVSYDHMKTFYEITGFN